jgi:membrane-associated phospholipid phosphatase
MRVRIRPTEAIHYAAILVLAVLTLIFLDRLAHPYQMLLGYGALAVGLAGMTLLARREDRLPLPLALLVNFYPAAFLPILFNTLEPLIEAVRGGPRDDLLIAADRALFGVDVTVWMERFVRPWLNDVFYIFYATYYFIALALGLILWFRDRNAGRRLVFTLMVVYYVSYAGYFTIPAVGPRFAQASEYSVSLTMTPISRAINDSINALEKTKCDVFPSGHTMVAVAVLLIAWRRARDVFWLFLAIASGLIVSTVYCRYHYVIDLVAGALLAVITVPLGEKLFERMTRGYRPRS